MFNMSSEWLFHNIAYELHLKRKSTADADIEYTGDFVDLTDESPPSKMAVEYVCSTAGKED